MNLLSCTDGLLKGTRYLVWGIALAGIACSFVLFLANLPLGLAAACVFGAAFFLSIGVTLLLLPGKLAKGKLEGRKRYVVGAAALLVALVIIALVWFANGGFPIVNLLFV